MGLFFKIFGSVNLKYYLDRIQIKDKSKIPCLDLVLSQKKLDAFFM